MRTLPLAALATTAMLALSACSNNTYADVVRFHNNQPITRGTLAIVPADPSVADSLEFRTHAETVAVQMRRIGYTTGLPLSQVQYVATMDVTQADSMGNITRPGVTVGAGIGAPIGNNAGVGANVAVPVNSSRRNPAMRSTTLSVQIRAAATRANIWEGRATKEANVNEAGANAGTAVPLLAEVLFRDFPGVTGQATRERLMK
jgi:hypothetical protein